MRFQGKRVLVTCANGGIGRAAAVMLASEGAAVAVHFERDAVGAEQTATACGLASEAVPAIVRGEIGNYQAAEQIIDEAASALGGLDALVFYAERTSHVPAHPRGVEQTDETVWEEIGEGPLRGALAMVRSAARLMQQRGGAVVLVASAAMHTGDLPSALASSALLGLVAPLGRALAPRIRVNGVALGAFAAEAAHMVGESDERRLERDVLLRRLGRPEDAAGVVLFFASDDAAFITGRTLVVDGGRSVI